MAGGGGMARVPPLDPAPDRPRHALLLGPVPLLHRTPAPSPLHTPIQPSSSVAFVQLPSELPADASTGQPPPPSLKRSQNILIEFN
ncbi:hypothetical protein E2562_024121 [Oryza meyeriana var. granulata]|uniref:Uncharacterized protein n=1 Tax=Oryza meyeriana var. granulata TaxID=110450 RepID=A0A6G1EP55_9ORYZ|nr:hypothetical protein E2562_024121 [Oryza meyeriana var. granulata]